MAKTMTQFPFPPMGKTTEFICDTDYELNDSAFSDKTNQVARKNDVVILATRLNYGIVTHPVHGLFRF